MFPLQRFTIVFVLGISLMVEACGEGPKPAATDPHEGAASANDAAGVDAGADGGSGQLDSGSPNAVSGGAPSVDGSAPSADAGLADSGGTTRSDAATASLRDGGFADGAGDAATAGDAIAEGGSTGDGGVFTLTSPAFDNVAGCSQGTASSCDAFPDENISYMQDAASETANISPALDWTGIPAGTQSFALLLQDVTLGAAHWVLWNIPGTTRKLEKNVAKSSAMPATPVGSQQCNSTFAAGNGYFGPGSRCNVYEFVLYALAVPMYSPTPATDADQVRRQLQALDDDILGTASLRGRANYMMMCGD